MLTTNNEGYGFYGTMVRRVTSMDRAWLAAIAVTKCQPTPKPAQIMRPSIEAEVESAKFYGIGKPDRFF